MEESKTNGESSAPSAMDEDGREVTEPCREEEVIDIVRASQTNTFIAAQDKMHMDYSANTHTRGVMKEEASGMTEDESSEELGSINSSNGTDTGASETSEAASTPTRLAATPKTRIDYDGSETEASVGNQRADLNHTTSQADADITVLRRSRALWVRTSSGRPGAFAHGSDRSYPVEEETGSDQGPEVPPPGQDSEIPCSGQGPEFLSSGQGPEVLGSAAAGDVEEQVLLEATLVVDDIVEAVPASKFGPKCSFLLAAVVALLLVGLVVAITVPLVDKDNNASSDADGVDSNLVPFPSDNTPIAETQAQRFDSLRTYLSQQVTEDGSLFDDPETPQYKALYWLAEEDPAQISLWVQGEARVKQRYVMAVLYYSTNGDDWFDSCKFLTREHECNWITDHEDPEKQKGVKCNGWAGAINDIRLYWNNLNGTIPQEMSHLPLLGILYLGINHLYGTIPDIFSQTPYLLRLALNDNDFEGTAPASLADLPALETLQLYSNPRLVGNLDFVCDSREEPFLFFPSDCGGDIPPVECPCCTYCCDPNTAICCANVYNSTDCFDSTPVENPFERI